MKILKAPELHAPDFPYTPRWLPVPFGDATVQMAYIDEGPRDAPVVLLLHGEPSWSFLYRFMIRDLVAAGLRVVAPDLIGFGRSDKPSKPSDYSYARHMQSMHALLDTLPEVTLFCQDWGGLLGLRLVGERPDRFARVIAANTFLPTGHGNIGLPFRLWRFFAKWVPRLPISRILAMGTGRKLSREELGAYDAPFPTEAHKAGARAFPGLVPTRPDDPASAANEKAWETLRRFDKPFLTLFATGDPITRGLEKYLQERIPGAKDQPHTKIRRAGHFLQEDAGHELAAHIARFIAS